MDPTDSDGLELGHVAPLGQDNVPDVNQAHFCMSCEYPMTGLYCAQCGQKNDDYRRSIFTLVKELFQSITAIESRIWRTWLTLIFKPGQVARQFADGRRSHWSTPIRIYLAMSILLFGYMGLTNTHLFSVDLDVKAKDGVEIPAEEWTADDVELDFNINVFETQAEIDARNANRNFKLIEQKLAGDGLNKKINISPLAVTATDKELEDAKKSVDDALKDAPEEISEAVSGITDAILETADEISTEDDSQVIVNGEKIERKDWVNFATRFAKNPIVLTQSFNKHLPRLMFFMMPFTMLIGAMFIRDKKRALLYDHLVHAAYIHAFAFFLLFIGIVLSKVIPGSILVRAIWLVLLIYLPMSLKTMFGRGWIKTIWTAYGVGFIYLIILMISLTGFITNDVSSSFMAAI